jgi:hypothetical protein
MLLTVEAFVREKAQREIDPAVSREVRPTLRKVREEIRPNRKERQLVYSYLPSPRLGKHPSDPGRRGKGKGERSKARDIEKSVCSARHPALRSRAENGGHAMSKSKNAGRWNQVK